MRYAILLGAALAAATVELASADVVISTDATQNMSCSGGVCAPTATDAVLNVTDLENLLASGNVSVVTTNGNVQANNIDVAAAFSWSAANGLTLDAYQSITFMAPVTDGGSGSVSLTTNDGGNGGNLSFFGRNSLTITNRTVSLSINGARYKLESNIKSLAYAIGRHPRGAFALANDYDAKKDGIYARQPIPVAFSGLFNGLGHTISRLEIIDSADSNVGFVVELTGGMISSIGLENAVIRANVGYTGGLVGYQSGGTISNSWSSGKVDGGYSNGTGGLVGVLTGTAAVINSWSFAEVTNLQEGGAGGLVGTMDGGGSISGSFATGRVRVYLCVGGLVGSTGEYAGSITNSYAMGNVRSSDSRYAETGGLVGCTNGGSIASSYSTGSVARAVGLYVGGFIGDRYKAKLSHCYWDVRTSKTDAGVGFGSDHGLKGLSTKKLQSRLPTGFDPTIWAEDANINSGFPYLIANPPP